MLNENADSPEVPAVPEETTVEMRLAELEKEYTSLQEKYESLQQRSILEKVCFESGCTDPEYLRFCAQRQGIDPRNAEALRHFAGELAHAAPGCFNARIIPGSSAGTDKVPASAAGIRQEASAGDRIALIALSIDSAPDAVCR